MNPTVQRLAREAALIPGNFEDRIEKFAALVAEHICGILADQVCECCYSEDERAPIDAGIERIRDAFLAGGDNADG